MKSSIQALDIKIKAQRTNTLKKPFRDEKKGLKTKYEFSELNELFRSYSEYRCFDNWSKVGKLRKEVLNDYRSNFGLAKQSDVLEVVPVESAFELLWNLCINDPPLNTVTVTTIHNKLLKKCIPPNVTGINNNLVIYFIESLRKAADLSLTTRQVTLGSDVYSAVKDAGGFGICQFVLSPDRKQIPLDPKLKKVTRALKFPGDNNAVTKDINTVLMSYGKKPIRDLTNEELEEIHQNNKFEDKFEEQSDEAEEKYIEEMQNQLVVSTQQLNHEDNSTTLAIGDAKSQEVEDNLDHNDNPNESNESTSTNVEPKETNASSSDEKVGENGNQGKGDDKNDENEDHQERNNNSSNHNEETTTKSSSELQLLGKRKFAHVMLNVFTTEYLNVSSDPRDNKRKDYHVLMLYCVSTRFCIFEKVFAPFDFQEIGSKLNYLSGFFGDVESVSFYDDGKCFNEARYIYTGKNREAAGYNRMFDETTPFGDLNGEKMGRALYKMMVSKEYIS